MKSLTAPMAAAVATTITTPAYLVELGWTTVLRLSSRGDQSWDGQTWVGGRLGKVSLSAAQGSIEIGNSDLAYSALILTESAADIGCRAWKFYGDNPANDDPIMIFDGILDGATIDRDRVVLTLAQANRRTMYSPRLFIGPENGFHHLAPTGTRITWGGQTYILERP